MNNIELSTKTVGIGGNVVCTKMNGLAKLESKTFHNKTTKNLFIGLAKFMRGDFLLESQSSSSYMPLFLGIGKVGASIADWSSSNSAYEEAVEDLTGLSSEYNESNGVSDRVPMTATTITVSNNTVYLTISGYIPAGYINEGSKITELGLFSTKKTNTYTGLLAKVVISDTDEFITMNKGEGVQIDWTMIISNGD